MGRRNTCPCGECVSLWVEMWLYVCVARRLMMTLRCLKPRIIIPVARKRATHVDITHSTLPSTSHAPTTCNRREARSVSKLRADGITMSSAPSSGSRSLAFLFPISKRLHCSCSALLCVCVHPHCACTSHALTALKSTPWWPYYIRGRRESAGVTPLTGA